MQTILGERLRVVETCLLSCLLFILYTVLSKVLEQWLLRMLSPCRHQIASKKHESKKLNRNSDDDECLSQAPIQLALASHSLLELGQTEISTLILDTFLVFERSLSPADL